MLSIRTDVQDFVDEDETKYETDEIKKEITNEFSIFIVDQKSKNTKHKAKYDKETFSKFCRKKNEKREGKNVLFPP